MRNLTLLSMLGLLLGIESFAQAGTHTYECDTDAHGTNIAIFDHLDIGDHSLNITLFSGPVSGMTGRFNHSESLTDLKRSIEQDGVTEFLSPDYRIMAFPTTRPNEVQIVVKKRVDYSSDGFNILGIYSCTRDDEAGHE